MYTLGFMRRTIKDIYIKCTMSVLKMKSIEKSCIHLLWVGKSYFFRMSFTCILCMTIRKRTYTHNHKIPHQTEDGSTNFHIERFLNVQTHIHIFTYTQIHTDIFFYVHSQSTQVVWLIHHQHITMAYQHALFIPKASVRIKM